MGDDIWLPDRHGVRTPMQWSAAKNAAFSDADELYLPVIDDPEYGYEQVNVAAQENDPDSYLWATRFLLMARRECPELQSGEMEWFATESEAVLAYWRILDPNRTLCLFNLGNQPASISLDLRDYEGWRMVDLLQEEEVRQVDRWPAVHNLAPYGSHWLRLEAPQ